MFSGGLKLCKDTRVPKYIINLALAFRRVLMISKPYVVLKAGRYLVECTITEAIFRNIVFYGSGQ